jgi:hypothetical protein
LMLMGLRKKTLTVLYQQQLYIPRQYRN